MLTKVGAYLRKHWRAILFVFILVLLGLSAFLRWSLQMTWADWTGLGPYLDADGKLQRGKTLWDWLELLIIPFVLALGAWWLQRSERDSDRKLAEERQDETALQDFIDKMTGLLLDEKHPLRDSKPEDEVRVVARTRTLATLRGLDPARKGMLLEFLYEAELIAPRTSKNNGDEIKENETVESTIVYLSGANLTKADLKYADLSRANLRGANLGGTKLIGADLSMAILAMVALRCADLRWANLTEADLSEADLSEADLSGSNLSGSNLSRAHLSGADLTLADLSGAHMNEAQLIGAKLIGAQLSGAKLSGAKLSGAKLIGAQLSRADLSEANLHSANLRYANLRYANLRYANLREINLRDAILDDATMPDGKQYDPSIHIIDEDGHYVGPPAETQPPH